MLDSVRRHLVADVPVGAFLSAGVDSGSLVGLMRDAGQSQICLLYTSESSFDSGPARRGVQGAAEDAARELARFKPAELKEDRAEPKFAAPPPRVRRGQDVEDLDLDSLTTAEPRRCV